MIKTAVFFHRPVVVTFVQIFTTNPVHTMASRYGHQTHLEKQFSNHTWRWFNSSSLQKCSWKSPLQACWKIQIHAESRDLWTCKCVLYIILYRYVIIIMKYYYHILIYIYIWLYVYNMLNLLDILFQPMKTWDVNDGKMAPWHRWWSRPSSSSHPSYPESLAPCQRWSSGACPRTSAMSSHHSISK